MKDDFSSKVMSTVSFTINQFIMDCSTFVLFFYCLTFRHFHQSYPLSDQSNAIHKIQFPVLIFS